jgi:LacI family transcriptional regulator
VRFIREYACHGITVADVLAHVLISRSGLERKFRSYLARSPQAEIRAIQLARAKQLLAATDHPIHRIAELVGYQHIEYFNVAFKREVGQTPGQYRRRARPPGGRGPFAQSIEPASMI